MAEQADEANSKKQEPAPEPEGSIDDLIAQVQRDAGGYVPATPAAPTNKLVITAPGHPPVIVNAPGWDVVGGIKTAKQVDNEYIAALKAEIGEGLAESMDSAQKAVDAASQAVGFLKTQPELQVDPLKAGVYEGEKVNLRLHWRPMRYIYDYAGTGGNKTILDPERRSYVLVSMPAFLAAPDKARENIAIAAALAHPLEIGSKGKMLVAFSFYHKLSGPSIEALYTHVLKDGFVRG